MYDKTLNSMIEHHLIEKELRYTKGQALWVNPLNRVTEAHQKIAKGLSNDKVQHKAVVKSGVAEMLAVQHRKAQIGGLHSSMIGIVVGKPKDNNLISKNRYQQ